MKNRIIALLALVAIVVSFAACTVPQEPGTTEQAETDQNPIVAQVNGEPIYYDQFNRIFESACAQYNIAADDETSRSEIKTMIIDSLVDEMIMKQKLTEEGYMNLNDEQLAQADKEAKDYLDQIIDNYYGYQIQSELGEGYTEEQYAEAKVPYEDQILSEMGYTREEFLEFYKMAIAEDAAREALVGDTTPTEEDIKAKYDEKVASDKEMMSSDPAQYEGLTTNGITVFYVPSGVRKVRQVLIKIDDTTTSAISLLRGQGFNDQADILLDKALADIKPDADDVLSKIKSKKITFGEAIATYNADKAMPEDGYPIVEGGTTYMASFSEAAMGLKAKGDYSDLVTTDYGYHIIEYYNDVPEGAVAYDSVKDEIRDGLSVTKQDDAWKAIVDQWKESSEVIRYEENM